MEFTTAAPVVETTTENLWAESIHPMNGRVMVECAVPVTWLRVCEAQVVFVHGGKTVAAFGTYNDFYGFMTCLRTAIEDSAKSVAEGYAVGPTSSASIDVILTVRDRPVMYADSAEAQTARSKHEADSRYKLRWLEFPDKFRRRERDEYAQDATSPGWLYTSVEPPAVASLTAWSTSSPVDDVDALVEKLRAQFLPPAAAPAGAVSAPIAT